MSVCIGRTYFYVLALTHLFELDSQTCMYYRHTPVSICITHLYIFASYTSMYLPHMPVCIKLTSLYVLS